MTILHNQAALVAELGNLSRNMVSEAVGQLCDVAAGRVGEIRLHEFSMRLEKAVRALRGEESGSNVASSDVSQRLGRRASEGAVCMLAVGKQMVDSYFFDPRTGRSTATMPAGVTDVEAIAALNEYFRAEHPSFERGVVEVGDVDWYETLPRKFPLYCRTRDYSRARELSTEGMCGDFMCANRSDQAAALEALGLRFSDPRDQAIMLALHACKYGGVDLLRGKWVRGSVPGFALINDQLSGICVGKCGDDRDRDITASGIRL